MEHVVLKIEYLDHAKILLTNSRGDTYSSKSEELKDFLHNESIEESEQDEFKYPTYEQSGGSKEWDDMNELEKANYNLCKALNAIAVSKTTIKRLREKLNANN